MYGLVSDFYCFEYLTIFEQNWEISAIVLSLEIRRVEADGGTRVLCTPESATMMEAKLLWNCNWIWYIP